MMNLKYSRHGGIPHLRRQISNIKFSRGQMLTELLIAMGLMAIFMPALITGLVAGRGGKDRQQQRLQAVNFLKETEEAVRSVKEQGWDIFIENELNDPLHPQIDTSSWELATGAETINGYTRQIMIHDVYRNGLTGPIVSFLAPGAVIDPSTKEVEITVSWNTPFPTSISSSIYLTRYLENQLYTETTEAQFNDVGATRTGVTVRATTPETVTDDGEITLGSGGYSDWCTPTLLVNPPNTPDSDGLPGSGYASSITAIEGKVFAGTGENASGMSFMQIDINNTHPPIPDLVSTFDGYKTNGVFGEANYGYISTDTNNEEVVIINIASTPFTKQGWVDLPGNLSARGIYVLGNTGYVTAGNKLYNFNLDSKTGSRSLRDADGVDLGGAAGEVYIVGDYAYVSTANSSRELQIINVSNPSNLVVTGYLNLNGGAGKSIYVNSTGTRAYIALAASAQAELFIINVTTKTAPTVVSSYDAAGMDPRGVTIVPGNRAILVGYGGEEYQVINIANEASPVHCGGAQLDDGIHDVASIVEADSDAYSYIVTADADAEFRIIEGGPGGGASLSGSFESKEFDLQFTSANNRFSATYSKPPNTDIQFQVSLADQVGGVCPTSGYTFVGPDGTTGTYFTQASGAYATFPFGATGTYTNPGRCFRYKAYLTSTDGSSTPVLYDVTINYSP